MITVIIATYGDSAWETMAEERAWPSVIGQNPAQLITEHQPDGNIAAARNAAAERATQDWLLFLDADDELAPGYLHAMTNAIHQHPDLLTLFTPAVEQVRKGRPSRQRIFFDRGIDLRADNWLVVGTVVHRRLFHQVGGFGDYPHGFEDWSLWSKCWRVGAKIVKVPGAVYLYHVNPQSKHRQGWRDRKWQVATHQRVAAELDAWEAAQ